MDQALCASRLVPAGFIVDSVVCDDAAMCITIRHRSNVSACPSCGVVSRRVHSRIAGGRRILPLSGRSVRLLVVSRRRCDAVLCRQQIFTERFAEGVLAPSTHGARASRRQAGNAPRAGTSSISLSLRLISVAALSNDSRGSPSPLLP